MASSSSTPSATLTTTSASDTPFFTNNPAATQTAGGGGGGGGGGFSSQSTPLYLFTFLATLFVLLFVSCAIVLRSFFLRRRLRRRIDEAMANGMWLPPDGGLGSRRRGFGEKPQLWDASLSGTSDEGWEKVKPVSVRLISYETNASPTPPPQPKSGLLRNLNPFSHMRSWRRSRSASSSSSLTAPASPVLLEPPESSSTTTIIDDSVNSASEVEVSVIIAMPDPHRPSHGSSPAEFMSGKGKERLSSADSYWSEHEEGVPDVVLGACRVPFGKVTDIGSPKL